MPPRPKFLLLAALCLVGPIQFAHADMVAIFGDNETAAVLSSGGANTVVSVTESQIATPGFLNGFDVFYFTRSGNSFGTGLSLAAATQVIAYVGTTGNIVLFNGDFADNLGSDPVLSAVTREAVAFAGASGHGFVGEFNGAVSALTSNANGFLPLNLIPGLAGPLNYTAGGADSNLVLTPAGAASPITASIPANYNPPGVEYGATINGVNSSLILATYSSTGTPAIIAREGTPLSLSAPMATVPEPGPTLSVGLLAGLCFVDVMRRRRRQTSAMAAEAV